MSGCVSGCVSDIFEQGDHDRLKSINLRFIIFLSNLIYFKDTHMSINFGDNHFWIFKGDVS